MGTDIYTHIEVKQSDKWIHLIDYEDRVFSERNYGVFGFLANVRNYSAVQPLSERRGLPPDISVGLKSIINNEYEYEPYGSYFTLKELLSVNYNQIIWDRRFNGKTSERERLSLKDFLGKKFMEDLDFLKTLGKPENVRILFWFD